MAARRILLPVPTVVHLTHFASPAEVRYGCAESAVLSGRSAARFPYLNDSAIRERSIASSSGGAVYARQRYTDAWWRSSWSEITSSTISLRRQTHLRAAPSFNVSSTALFLSENVSSLQRIIPLAQSGVGCKRHRLPSGAATALEKGQLDDAEDDWKPTDISSAMPLKRHRCRTTYWLRSINAKHSGPTVHKTVGNQVVMHQLSTLLTILNRLEFWPGRFGFLRSSNLLHIFCRQRIVHRRLDLRHISLNWVAD